MKYIWGLSSLFFIVGCNIQKNSYTLNKLSSDFVIQTFREKMQTNFKVNSDCDKHLENTLCLSDSAELAIDPDCSKEKITPEQISELKKYRDLLPPYHQRVLCHLNQIQVQKNIFSIAFAGQIRNQSREPVALMMGLRPEVLSSQSSDLDSWKEQLNFGISDPNDRERKFSKQGPLAAEVLSDNIPVNLTTIIHELNHLIDALNSANTWELTDCRRREGNEHIVDCQTRAGSFNRFYWGEMASFVFDLPPEDHSLDHLTEPFWKSKFPQASRACYYYCKQTIPLKEITLIFEDFKRSDFVTPYSAQSEFEDFAESSTHYLMDQMGLKYSYRIYDSKQTYFESSEQYFSSNLKLKRQWLENFYGKDLKYKIN